MTAIKQRKIDLPILNAKGEALSQSEVDKALLRADTLAAGGALTDVQTDEMAAQGSILDTKGTMLELVSRAADLQSGMNYAEIEQIRGVAAKLVGAEPNSCIYLEEAEFVFVCAKVQMKYLVKYNLTFDLFVQRILSAELVELEEKDPPY